MKNKKIELKKKREQLGLTQQEVADQLGIERSYYCKIENGERKATLKLAMEIDNILKLDVKDFKEITKYFVY